MAQNEPERKDRPPGPSPNSPSLLFEYQCRSGKFIRLANRIKSKLFCPNWNALLCSWWRLLIIYGLRRILQIIDHDANYKSHCWWGLYCLQFTIFAHWEMTLKMPNVSTVKTRWNYEIGPTVPAFKNFVNNCLIIFDGCNLYTSKKCTYNYIESVDYKTTINDGLRIKFTRLLQQQQGG